MTSASKRALPSSRCRHGNRNPFTRASPLNSRSPQPSSAAGLRSAAQPPLVASRRARRAPRAFVEPRCYRRPRRRRPACVTPCRHLPLLLPPPVCLSRRSRRHTCMLRARACVRYGVSGEETPSTTLAAAAPAALVAWPKTIDVPLSGPKRQNSSEKGRACSTYARRGAAPPRRRSPDPTVLRTPWPIGAELAQALPFA